MQERMENGAAIEASGRKVLTKRAARVDEWNGRPGPWTAFFWVGELLRAKVFSIRTILVFAVAVQLLGRAAALDAASVEEEYLVKAAFVYNFAQFVEWPADAFPRSDSPIVIGVIGEDPFGEAITRSMAGKTAKGHPFVVRQLGINPAARQCHIIVPGFDRRRL